VSIVPSPWTVLHIERSWTGPTDDHNNPTLVESPPVPRKVMSVTQFGRRGSSRELVSPDYVQRTETIIHLAVGDPSLYHPDDQIILWPDFDATGAYVPDSGTAYWVDGLPSDERNGPWPFLLSLFGGLVRLRRVT
jgi:hypothetical protein